MKEERATERTEDRAPLSGTLEKGLAVLSYFAGAGAGEGTPVAVARSLGLSRSAAYRVCEVLKQQGFLEVDPMSDKLRLGFRAAELGMAALSGIDAVRLAPTYLRGLVEATLETVFLAVVDGDAVVYVYKEEGPRSVTMSSQLGSRRPLHCTALGRAYMSALPDEGRRSLVEGLEMRRLTDNTVTDVSGLEEIVALTRRRGYAVDDDETEEGVACLAAPVLDHSGLPVASISVAGPRDRVLPREAEVGPLVAETAGLLSRRLGYAKPPGPQGGA